MYQKVPHRKNWSRGWCSVANHIKVYRRGLRLATWLAVIITFSGEIRLQQSNSNSVNYYISNGRDFVRRARAVSAVQGYVNLLFFNAAYLPFCQSWICNVRCMQLTEVINMTLFVAMDELAAATLQRFQPNVNVYLWRRAIASNASLRYGTFEYFELTSQRLELQNALIQAKISVLMLEADATVFSRTAFDRLPSIFSSVDIVSADDRGDGLISAGFLLCKSNLRVRRFFQAYTALYTQKLSELSSKDHRFTYKYDYGEQHLMTRMLQESHLKVHWLPECEFTRGEWYSSEELRRRCPAPALLQNNYLVGNTEKIHRVKRWKHWFVDESLQRCTCTRHTASLLLKNLTDPIQVRGAVSMDPR